MIEDDRTGPLQELALPLKGTQIENLCDLKMFLKLCSHYGVLRGVNWLLILQKKMFPVTKRTLYAA